MTIVHRFKLKYDISNYNGIYYRHVVRTIPPSRILPQLRMMMKSNNDDADDDDDDDDDEDDDAR